ncbi:MAG: esterase [Bacteroidaceae bacterium]|nr:esterase [Bacteroidaceae bacterium]
MKKIVIILWAVLGMCIPTAAQEVYSFGRQAAVSPEISENSVTFRYHAPKAHKVTVSPSWLGWGSSPIELTEGENGIWSVTVPKPESELYTYTFNVDGISTLDPSNIFVQRDGPRYSNGLLIEGGHADLYKEAQHKGNIHQDWYWSASDGMERRMYVYTPYGYEKGKNYPVLYLLHGGGGDEDAWCTLGRARQILDNLIEQGKAKPMLVVMPNGNPNQYAAGTLQIPTKKIERQFTNNFNNYQSLAADILPYIEQHYKVSKKRTDRAVAGLSMGGGQSFFVAFNHVDKFANVGIFSTGLFGGNIGNGPFDGEKEVPGIFSNAGQFNKFDLLYISCGEQDDRLKGTNVVVDNFRRAGYPVTYETYPGNHEWKVWRRNLASFVQQVFH